MSQKIEKQIYFGSKDELEQNKNITFKQILHAVPLDGDWLLSHDISTSKNCYKIIQLGNIGFGIFKKQKFKYISHNTFQKLNCTIVSQGDLVFNRMLDKDSFNFCIIDDADKYVTSVDVVIFKDNNKFANTSLKYLFMSNFIQNKIISLASGSGRIRISKKNLLNLDFPSHYLNYIDNKSSILSQIDNLMNLKKIEILKQMQHSIKRLIFDREYEMISLSHISEYLNGSTLESSVVEYNTYQKLISLNSITLDGKLSNNLKSLVSNEKPLLINDIVMVLSDVAHGDFLGVSALIDKENTYYLNQRIAAIRCLSDYNANFIRNYINYNQRYFKTKGQGSSQQNLNKPDVINFMVPNIDIDIQHRIANILSQMDKLIEIEEKKLEQLEKMKKYHLQQFFN